MPVVKTKGAASSQGFGEFSQSSGPANYIEDMFSTYLYAGNGSTQTINNGIDLAGKGGLVWLKRRDASGHNWVGDTVRGRSKLLITNSTGAEQTSTAGNDITSFNSNGFSLGPEWVAPINTSGATYVSWTFRKQPKFFDVVTYTGDGVDPHIINHSLGVTPGMIIVKRTDSTGNWQVWHKDVDAGGFGAMVLNTTAAAPTGNYVFKANSVNSTSFGVRADATVNASGGTYVAYLFAHNAGGFGASGTDNVISCGSFTQVSAGIDVNLGYEPQWILYKDIGSGGYDWQIIDNMRGFTTSTADKLLQPNLSAAESSNNIIGPTATGFHFDLRAGTYIYIAIRRGPMKVPTSGTSVYTSNTYGSGSNPPSFLSTFPVDMMLFKNKAIAVDWRNSSRLLQGTQLITNTTAAETTNALNTFDYMNGWHNDTGTNTNIYSWMFRRAPGFFDEVCYTQTGGGATVTHNLGVSPELAILKPRTTANGWKVYSSTLGGSSYLQLHTTIAAGSDPNWFSATSTSFTVAYANDSTVAYLFASCPGVSKVTSFTGNGSTQTINCGFTGGARFVLIKATSTTGNWLTFDTSRGMTTSTDPWLALNSTAAESATTGACTTTSVGFTVDESKLTGVNTNGVSYIVLAVA